MRKVLYGQIKSGQYPVGETLPTEEELQRTFKVSRSTIRNALRDLAADGLIKARPRVGTVVIRARPEVQASELRGLTEDLRQQGLSTKAKVLAAAFVEPSPAIRAHLELATGERALELKRLRNIAGTPFAFITSYVPESIGLTLDEDFSEPLYRVIERFHNLHIIYGRDVIAARGVKDHEAELLRAEPGTPVLVIRRTAYLEHDRPVEYVEAVIRSDLYEYTVTLLRGKDMQ